MKHQVPSVAFFLFVFSYIFARVNVTLLTGIITNATLPGVCFVYLRPVSVGGVHLAPLGINDTSIYLTSALLQYMTTRGSVEVMPLFA